jgi:hypothetical protein
MGLAPLLQLSVEGANKTVSVEVLLAVARMVSALGSKETRPVIFTGTVVAA